MQFITVTGKHTVDGAEQHKHGPFRTLEQAREKAREEAARLMSTPHAEAEISNTQWYALDLDRHGSGSYDEFVYIRLAWDDEEA